MTDNDIRDYIEACDEPIILRGIMSELTSKDPTISFKRVARILREMGFENKMCKNALNPKGKGSLWTRVNAVATSGDDDYDDDVDDYDDDYVDEVDEVDDEVDEVYEDGVCDAEKTEVTKDTKARARSTADALHDVSAKNDEDSGLLQRLFVGLNRSRSLKEELMKRQQEMLLELARRILGLYGSEKERKTYGDF